MVAAEELRGIDEWRRLQPDLPSRSEAIRRLVEKAMKAEKGADMNLVEHIEAVPAAAFDYAQMDESVATEARAEAQHRARSKKGTPEPQARRGDAKPDEGIRADQDLDRD